MWRTLVAAIAVASVSSVWAEEGPRQGSSPRATSRQIWDAVLSAAPREPISVPADTWPGLALGGALSRPGEHSRFGNATQVPTVRQRSKRQKILGALVGGAGGFFGGLFLGAAIEGDRCDCDDPGLVGAAIGAPAGGIAGSILGYRFLF